MNAAESGSSQTSLTQLLIFYHLVTAKARLAVGADGARVPEPQPDAGEAILRPEPVEA